MTVKLKGLQKILAYHRKWLAGREDGVLADLSELDLSEVDFSRLDLRWVNFDSCILRKADFRGAKMIDCNLTKADLSKADLRHADLSDAILRRADMRSANLSEADLSYADMTGCDLRKANFSMANLKSSLFLRSIIDDGIRQANFSPIKKDLFSILEVARPEIRGLVEAIKGGRIDGSVYEGECCCLVGTIAKLRNTPFYELDSIRPSMLRPAERWFSAIEPGDTPETSLIAKITLEWVEEFMKQAV